MTAIAQIWRASAAMGIVVAALLSTPTVAETLLEPPLFASQNGILDILIVAKSQRISTLRPFRPNGWVYQICLRPSPDAMACPPDQQQWYGGTRLQLQKGDRLKMRLVNRLPPDFAAKHARDPGLAYLTLNPTNLHTHGLLVSPHYPTIANPTYGDNVFVLTLNPANGQPGKGQHIHGDLRYGSTDYDIKIPRNHPSGLYWFHPHAHGIALNQVSSGMSGIITIGDPSDYICGRGACATDIPPVRHLILKDLEALPNGVVVDQQDPALCPFHAFPDDPPRHGFCLSGLGGVDPNTKAHWFFTINGQLYPTIPVAAPAGEIWRITNTSASVTYSLELWNPTQQRNMLMQVVAIDGVSISPNPVTSARGLADALGTQFSPEPCAVPGAQMPPGAAKPLCARRLVMWPSSRVEVWVTYRDSSDATANPPAEARAIFRTSGMRTGPQGDSWPIVDLANVTFAPVPQAGGPQPALTVNGEAGAMLHPVQLAAELAAQNRTFVPEADCAPLAPGHMRRIFFNSIQPPPVARGAGDEGAEPPFGLGYEEIDEFGNPVPGTFQDVSVFDPARPTICLPLGPGNAPVAEKWQLINLAGEDHNFHMHQTKFRLVSVDRVEGTRTPNNGVLHDNVPVRHASGTCNTVADWRNGACVTRPVVVEIPFAIAGDYVYHCHILEHEDGGMMARIRVRRSQ